MVNQINRKYTKVGRPQTNGKAERVIRTLMEMWHDKHEFCDTTHREQELKRFINFYNTVKPHTGLNETLETYFFNPMRKQRGDFLHLRRRVNKVLPKRQS